ncbi:response regulator transcription factor [Actimicrobium sp. CCI2.3]|uniref:response regulator transcription factor n=1 Tax=Actimicrobium sp. CCI2.3 TaxID=3048616 RepID=UPI002AB5778A|nr:response regulator transcription factor [Actimicrobium sp. CCI2.3]MDY7574763.1 response regulator transcription factor [Actimicrobium sp. CCI2.3]MEB0020276.1 response regulator transcription factor [Actimicrobium sp. CCI2.3]
MNNPGTSNKATILLVDDHVLVRAGIRSLIDQLNDFIVIAEASDPVEALAWVAQREPDIVVTDLTMGNHNGLDLVRQLRQQYPQVAIVILSMHASEELVTEALRLGASAYLLKEAAPAELDIALQAIRRHETYLSPAVSTKMIDRFIRAPVAAPNPLQSLTGRQLQILTMIAGRKSTKEIAFELDLSEKTVAAHRAQIMERLGVRDVVGLALLALRYGLVSADSPFFQHSGGL